MAKLPPTGKTVSRTSTFTSTSNKKGKSKACAPAELSPTAVTVTSSASTDVEYEGVESCLICAEPMHVYAVFPCNHTTCGRCALRLRALYKQKACVYCKAEATSVVFTQDPGRTFGSFTPDETSWRDERLGIQFDSDDAMDDVLELLLFHCPHVRCDHTLPETSAVVAGISPSVTSSLEGDDGALYGWADLRQHVAEVHGRRFCDLCRSHKRNFPYEHALYTRAQLAAHEAQEHRLCEFCHVLFYGPDELFKHLRYKHFQCQMCAVHGLADPVTIPSEGEEHGDRHTRRAAEAEANYQANRAAEAQTWYRDYLDLEHHFEQRHFSCTDPVCRQQQYVVFGHESDYLVHRLKEHPANLTAAERKKAMRLDTQQGGSSAASTSTGRCTTRPTRPTPSSTQDTEAAAQQAFVGWVTIVLGSNYTSATLATLRSSLTAYRADRTSAQSVAETVLDVVDTGPALDDDPDANVASKLSVGHSLVSGMVDLLVSTPSQGGDAVAKAAELQAGWAKRSDVYRRMPVDVPDRRATRPNASATDPPNPITNAINGARRVRGAANRSTAAMDKFLPMMPPAPPAPPTNPKAKGKAPTPATKLDPRNAAIPGTAAHSIKHQASSSSLSSSAPRSSPNQSTSTFTSHHHKNKAQQGSVHRIVRSSASNTDYPSNPTHAPWSFPDLPKNATQADRWDAKYRMARDKTVARGGPSVWASSSSGSSSPVGAHAATARNGTSSSSAIKGDPGGIHANRKGKKGKTVMTLGNVRR